MEKKDQAQIRLMIDRAVARAVDLLKEEIKSLKKGKPKPALKFKPDKTPKTTEESKDA